MDASAGARERSPNPDALQSGPEALLDRYTLIRRQTDELHAPLSAEDCQIQSMPDVSPTKWHLAHTTWFFETFVLERFETGFRPVDPSFRMLFNSYYNAVGEQYPRPDRGLISRPNLLDVLGYRREVDARIARLLADDGRWSEELGERIELGLNHEQQHQELILMDIKHVLWSNPSRPAYRPSAKDPARPASPSNWVAFEGGIHDIGHEGAGFSFDNERPAHRALVEDFSLCSRLITNGEFLEFMRDGGYDQALLWLSDGWAARGQQNWRAPLYWEEIDGVWHVHTLAGLEELRADEPVCHVSYFEADAFASWADARLPREQEWEIAARQAPRGGNFAESGRLAPAPAASGGTGMPRQMLGDVWEWTRSSYEAYPGFRASADALGEYNGKFMCNQLVLRGGCCVTPQSHIRVSYRNFFPAGSRWQFGGIRLARDGA